MIIDSHCHLEYEPMFSNLDRVIARALDKNIKYLLTISTTNESYEKIKLIIKKYKEIYGTYGIHPHEAKSYKKLKKEDIIKKIDNNNKVIGIGETGLDFFYEHSDKNKQIDLFLQHIEAANKSHLPLIIHTRSAEEETYNILKKATQKNDLKILIHCFTGSKAFAHKLLDLGSYISVSGIVTFKKSIDLAGTIKNIPNDRLLIETDSPYLAPEPLRGKSNEPSFIIHTLNFLSQLKKIDKNELSNITTNNFFKLFGKVI